MPRLHWRILDALGLLFWAYLFTKIFVADVDRALLAAVAPNLVPLLDFRLVAYLSVLVLAIVTWSRTWMVALYVLGFPSIVLFVKVPWFLLRHRSWAMVLGVLQALTALGRDIRYNLVTKSVGIIAAILILFFRSPVLIVPCAVYIAWLTAWSLTRRLRGVFLRPSFVEVQRRLIRRIMTSETIRKLWTVVDAYKVAEIEVYDDQQAQQVAMTISIGISINKGLCLWAYQLDQYRKNYSPSLIF